MLVCEFIVARCFEHSHVVMRPLPNMCRSLPSMCARAYVVGVESMRPTLQLVVVALVFCGRCSFEQHLFAEMRDKELCRGAFSRVVV